MMMMKEKKKKKKVMMMKEKNENIGSEIQTPPLMTLISKAGQKWR